ncbi:MBL fold metallo-hydrolase RNA specificity domain-containing protein [Bacteroidota bacterium]
MKIQFFGGARTVTGSMHLLQIGEKKILLECGLYQGKRKDAYSINKKLGFDPRGVDYMLLSHAHIDHSGNIPNLIKNGFDGPIYATSATVDLCQVLLRDSAYLQERDIHWLNKKRAKKNQEPVEPLYTYEDVVNAMDNFVGIQYSKPFQLFPGVQVTFYDAGHILGSAGIRLEIEENGRTIRLGFSGDIGRPDMPILRDPNILRNLDALIIESTYGNRLHSQVEEIEEELAKTVIEVIENGGKIIIPAFAVGRTQLIVYLLHKLFDQNRIPVIPIFVDSPMAVAATRIFRAHPECYDRETFELFLDDYYDPFGFHRLQYVSKADKSKELNERNDAHIIISASGMAEGGRILHHLKNNIHNPKNLVLFVGYAAQHTLARRIMDGQKSIKIFGFEYNINCKVKTMDYFSAHADRNGLLEYIGFSKQEQLKNIFLVHGEEEQALPLREALVRRGYRNVEFPNLKDSITI